MSDGDLVLTSSATGAQDSGKFEIVRKAVSWNVIFSSLLAVMESTGKGKEKIEISSSRPGTMALLSEARSPEMTFLMRLMKEIARGMMNQEARNRGSNQKPQE